jgi:hypothetical protein
MLTEDISTWAQGDFEHGNTARLGYEDKDGVAASRGHNRGSIDKYSESSRPSPLFPAVSSEADVCSMSIAGVVWIPDAHPYAEGAHSPQESSAPDKCARTEMRWHDSQTKQ